MLLLRITYCDHRHRHTVRRRAYIYALGRGQGFDFHLGQNTRPRESVLVNVAVGVAAGELDGFVIVCRRGATADVYLAAEPASGLVCGKVTDQAEMGNLHVV